MKRNDHSESTPDGAMPDEGGALEGELIEPGTTIAPARPPGRKPMPPLHVIPPLTAEEISMLIADPHELLRRRTADYVTWSHNLISASPSKINRCAWAIESQRRMVEKLMSFSIPPARTALDPFGEMHQTSDEELIRILESLGPMPSETSEGQS